MSAPLDVTVDALERDVRHDGFGGTVEGWRAEVTLADGTCLSLSQLGGEAPAWGVDALFYANGAPRHCNGFGARYLRVTAASDALATVLNDAVLDAPGPMVTAR